MKEIINKAVVYFGVKNQNKKAVEELTELSLAIQHFEDGKVTKAEVVTEIADVLIMCEQLKIMYGRQAVEDQVVMKVERLEKKIREGAENGGKNER